MPAPPDWTFFRSALLDWYDPARRPMPWKAVGDPYRVWLSEIILQQTRVAQGLPYYERFLAAYPTVNDLADADDDAVMKLWEGLGYYSRARNLLRAARHVRDAHDGRFPDTYDGLRELPGVGPYTAAAIASFAFGRPVAVLDGNVYRVLARYAADATPTDGGRGRRHFQYAVDTALGDAPAAIFNQAIMDFGALVCTPRNPACSACPLSARCAALASGTTAAFPVKKPAAARRTRYFHYLDVTDAAGQRYLAQRSGNDIWQDLYEFPLLETETEGHTLTELRSSAQWPEWLPATFEEDGRGGPYRQQLSHQNIIAVFYRLRVAAALTPPPGIIRVTDEALASYAFPRVLNRYLDDRTLQLPF